MAVLAGLLVGVAAPRAEDVTATASVPPPQGVFIYTISREGAPIGQQRLEYVADGSKLRVISRIDISVKFLGIDLYGFDQQAEEVRSEGKLLSLHSEANDDGNEKTVTLALQGDHVAGIYNGKPTKPLDPMLISSLFWQQPALDTTRVIDSLRGKARDVVITDLGAATLDLPVGRVAAHHLRVAGDIKRELWYDDRGVLVAGEVKGKDGSVVRQELQQRP